MLLPFKRFNLQKDAGFMTHTDFYNYLAVIKRVTYVVSFIVKVIFITFF